MRRCLLKASWGGLGTWIASPDADGGLTPRTRVRTVAHGGNLYVVGGQDPSGNLLREVFHAPLWSDGGVQYAPPIR